MNRLHRYIRDKRIKEVKRNLEREIRKTKYFRSERRRIVSSREIYTDLAIESSREGIKIDTFDIELLHHLLQKPKRKLLKLYYSAHMDLSLILG